MSWNDLPADVRERAEAVLTERQLEVVNLRAGRLSWRRIGDAYGTTPVVGRGVGGAIRGTQPEHAIAKLLRDL
jgi:hypothetical protein